MISWSMPNEINYNLTRYRVQYCKIKDNIIPSDTFKDWPGKCLSVEKI